ncbi:hypothetical protein ACHWQZ_G001983 [Mnemiopsis leidyi]
MVTVPTNSTSYRSISLPNPCFLALYFLPKCNAKVPTPRRDDRLMHIPNIWKLLKGSSKDISPPNSRRIFTKRRRRHGGRIGSDHNLHHHRELDLEIDNLAAGTPEIKVFMKYKLPEFSEVQRYDLTKIHFDPVFRQIFDMYDKNGDNVINVEELRGILEILGYSPTPDEVKTILERFDQDNSGTIDFDEYLVLIQHWIEQDEEQIYEAFKVFDRDGDGFVSAQELKRALTQYGEQFTEDEANEFFNMMDTDGDGVINYEEFVEYLRSMQKYSTE